MKERFKRYMSRYKILLFIFVMAALAGCGNNAYTDSLEGMESVENVEHLEHIENDEVYINDSKVDIKYDKVDITRDEGENQESEDADDLNPMEIYERFLDGKLSVEQEEKQVTISNLFWDNDIKYCFLDIDGDGIDELHIKDNMIYYVIKAVDGAPKILFEGWWYNEPVVTDELCGILYCFNLGYGYEYIEFIQINPDGSTESDGEFSWHDNNKNGNMDADDSYEIYIGYDDSLEKFVGSEDIDMEQYIQYKKERSAQQAGYELEWTDRRLKEFATWQEAYIDFLKKPSATIWVMGRDSEDYSLIYIDDDDTPELYFYTGGAVYGETIVSFYDGKVRSMNRDRGGIKYIEYGGLLYSDWGNMGFYPCNIYMLEKGEFSEIGTGWIRERVYDNTIIGYAYYWEGKEVTETEYEECIKEKIDKSKCIEPSVLYSRDEMLEILTNS